MNHSVSVEVWGSGQQITDLDKVQQVLSECRANVVPLPLADKPARIRQLLAQAELTTDEQDELKRHFLLNREEMLAYIRTVREPHFSDGGSMETSHDHGAYPAFYYIVPPGMGSQPFEQLHVNTADNATGVDEVMQVVAGSIVWYFAPVAGGPPVKFTVVASADQGWKVTYDGGNAHGGTLAPYYYSMAQVIGPKTWTMRYLDLPNPWVEASATPTQV
jgi:hypothetical protein